jgi:uncharacterized protein (TIGR04255 family)
MLLTLQTIFIKQIKQMEFNNHKIAEVIGAIRFTTSWNSEVMNSYADLLRNEGFTNRQERIPVQISFQFQAGKSENIAGYAQSKESKELVLSNPDTQQAIIIGFNYLSFHLLNHYQGWEIFLPFIQSFFGKLESFEKNLSIQHIQVMYINTFSVMMNENVSDYLKFVPDTNDFGQGMEVQHSYQSNFFIQPNAQLFLRANIQTNFANSTKDIRLECSCVSSSYEGKKDLEYLANQAHGIAVASFKNVIQDHFKQQIL